MSISIDKAFLRQSFDDLLSVYQTVSQLHFSPEANFLTLFQIFLGGIRAEVTRQRLTISTYVALYSPAIEWIMHGIVTGSEDFVLDELVLRCQERRNCAPLFHAILAAFPREFIAARALHFVNILCKCDTETYSRSAMLRALGSCLSEIPPPPDQVPDVFEYVWRTVATFTQIEEYLTCVETWIPFIAVNLNVSERLSFRFFQILFHTRDTLRLAESQSGPHLS